MKKIIIALLITAMLVLFLNGCTVKKTAAMYTNDYLVSALGFEETGGRLTVVAETVIINTEDTEAEKKRVLLEGRGETATEAFADLYKSSVQLLEFSHCAVAVIDIDISENVLSQIIDYCKTLEKLNLSVQLVSSYDTKKLLSFEPVTSVAMGYDIVSMLSTNTDLKGIKYKNRLYEIEAQRKTELNIFALPSFAINKDTYFIDGLSVFKENSFALSLNNEQASIYAIASDSQTKGGFLIDSVNYKIESNLTTAQLSRNNPQTIIFTVKIKTNGDKKIIKEKIEQLFEYSKQYETDIFLIGNILAHRNTAVWQKVKNNYDEYYRDSELKVRMK